MKTLRILGIIWKRTHRARSIVLSGFGAGFFATHVIVCVSSWHPLHALLAALAALLVVVELYGRSSLKAARL